MEEKMKLQSAYKCTTLVANLLNFIKIVANTRHPVKQGNEAGKCWERSDRLYEHEQILIDITNLVVLPTV